MTSITNATGSERSAPSLSRIYLGWLISVQPSGTHWTATVTRGQQRYRATADTEAAAVAACIRYVNAKELS